MEFLFILFIFINGSNGNIPLFMFIYFESFLIYFLAFFLIKKEEKFRITNALPQEHIRKKFAGIKYSSRYTIPLFIVTAGVLFRITLFPAVPTTSPDVYRYVWEGKVIYNGFNPYLHSPDSPELAFLHDSEFPEKVTFKRMTAIYPPLSQYSFLLGYIISGEKLWGLKLIYLLCEILTMMFIMKLLELKKKNLHYVILYAWLPLPIMEFFINVHLDPLGITFFILFIYLLEKGDYLKSAVPFALSFLAKFQPIFLFPLLLKKIGFKKTIYFGLIFLGIVILCYSPFVYKNFSIQSALFTYLAKWEFNGSVYKILKVMFGNNAQIAHQAVGILLPVSILIISFKYKNFIKAVYGVFICLIIFNTTVYPWYLGWIAAVNPLVQFASLMSLFFTINASNFTPLGSVWQEYYRVAVVEYVPFFILLAYDLLTEKYGKGWIKFEKPYK